VINKAKWRWGKIIQKCSEVKWSEVICGEDMKGRKWGEVELRDGHGELWVHQFMTLSISLLLLFSV
jgi:hypothetical protein